MVQVVAQGVEQTGQQTRTQHVHVAAQWIGQWRSSLRSQPGRDLGYESLALCLKHAQAGKEASSFSQLVVHGVVGIRSDGAARWGRWDFIHSMESGHLFDKVDLAFQIHS